MKNRRLLAAVLVMTVVMSFLSACGSSAPKETAAAETTAAEITAAETKEETTAAETTEAATEPETEAKKEFPIEGEYTLFAAEEEGDRVASADMEMESVITLEEGGKGSMSFDGDSMGITEWTLDGEEFFLKMDDGAEAGGNPAC